MFGFITTPYVPKPYVDYSDPANVKAFWEQARAEARAEREARHAGRDS